MLLVQMSEFFVGSRTQLVINKFSLIKPNYPEAEPDQGAQMLRPESGL